MRVLIGVLLLACAWQTHARVQDWRSDRAIWTAATVSAPTLPRPWFNLAVVDLQTSQTADGWTHLHTAVRFADSPSAASVRPGLRRRAQLLLLWLDALEPRCDTPSWQAFCASLE